VGNGGVRQLVESEWGGGGGVRGREKGRVSEAKNMIKGDGKGRKGRK